MEKSPHSEQLQAQLPGPLRAIDRLTELIGSAVQWLCVAMVGLTTLVVLLRYGFDIGSVAVQELVTYFHAALFMLGASYTLRADGHVRVDVLYRRWSARRKAMVNAFGIVFLLLPTSLFIGWSSLPYVEQSWRIAEESSEAGGLPFVYILKTLIPLMALLLTLQGIVELYRTLKTISKRGDS
jgi:TRAP-type mannitol/chloroaromatic compound transport system permease small subunit